ncbi:MAG TPA: CDP-alcohol phosphatidyltransferase family protein, partial [Xanthomonadaceae bacterium]|nr:CDP-alcohol phosphatidyltransferase family protein [Xanthomonadaceae bacterium]
MKLTLPTALTLLRILLIPVLVLVFYLPHGWTNFASAFVFALAAVTDWL